MLTPREYPDVFTEILANVPKTNFKSMAAHFTKQCHHAESSFVCIRKGSCFRVLKWPAGSVNYRQVNLRVIVSLRVITLSRFKLSTSRISSCSHGTLYARSPLIDLGLHIFLHGPVGSNSRGSKRPQKDFSPPWQLAQSQRDFEYSCQETKL